MAAVYDRSACKRMLVRFLLTAFDDSRLSIRPLIEIIADYAEFVGSVRTVFRSGGILRGIAADGRTSFILADGKDHCFRRLCIDGSRSEPALFGQDPTAVCIDPAGKHFGATSGLFVANCRSIYRFDGRPDPPVLRCHGDTIYDVGWIGGMVSTTDGKTLFCTDNNNGTLMEIDSQTGKIRRLIRGQRSNNVEYEHPRKLVFYRSPTTKPDSVLFIATRLAICRFDVAETAMTVCLSVDSNPRAIVCTATGVLIFSCDSSWSLYAVRPDVGRPERIAGTGRFGNDDGDSLTAADFRSINDICLIDGADQAWLVDDSAVRTVDLPPHLFVLEGGRQ